MIPAEAVEAAARAYFEDCGYAEWDHMFEGVQAEIRADMCAALEAAAPYISAANWLKGYEDGFLAADANHILTGALLGHINRGPIEGFVGERCECGHWSDSDADYIAHVRSQAQSINALVKANPYRPTP